MKTALDKSARGIVVRGVELAGPKCSFAVDLILDTGAAYTMIAWDTAMLLGYDPARQSKSVPIVTANGKVHVPMIFLRRISLEDIHAVNVPAICHDIPEIVEVSGLLGLSFLRHFRTTINYRSLTLQIE